MSDLAIRVENLSKAYRITHRSEAKRYKTLQEDLMALPRRLWAMARGRSESHKTFWALEDVSFEVKEGEVMGIIGRNGAGKSTLLKILSRITEPTKGRAEIYGRVGSLLEVGTGFHPELTGRENIYLSGAVLGMTREEVKRKFDEIVAFAEVEEFIDTPAKRYSSGMYVRLGFAVAAHLEPEILLVDEVLAVGDAAFQKKCLGKMGDVAKQGRTVLFVSHNMGAIQRLCKRAIWIDSGRIMADGDAPSVVGQYIDSASEGFVQHPQQARAGLQYLVIERVVLKNGEGEATVDFESGDRLIVEVHYNALSRILQPYFWISISSQFGSLFGSNMLLDNLRPDHIEGRGVISCIFKDVRLLPQTFTISMGVRDQTGRNNLVSPANVAFFRVKGNAHDLGMAGELADAILGTASPMVVPYEWRFMAV
jgi:lipopolysaccharide transport system ATP-binding protein